MSFGPEAPVEFSFPVDREVIVLTSEGVWIADGAEVTHEPTRRLFARSLEKDEQGYFLHIGRETKRIHVEDTAYFVQRLDGDPIQGFELWLSDETRERLDPLSLTHRPGRLVCRIKAGQQGVQASQDTAKFLRGPYMEILQNLQEDERGYYLEFSRREQQSFLRVDL